ncbi:MAG: phage N-6-adenine-methyltransferase [Psychromonas sp.]|jgi:phage N-6-adenine-methyltransferase|uniref:phage N-6-adenine-methyltransferase n=1 Tax=Psychromonas sp. TaxID=1884585 RepID=UPI0039E3AFC8
MADYISSELTNDDKNSWSTPEWLFAAVNNEFDFKVDIAANNKNTKCNSYIDIEQNALIMNNWADATPLLETLAFKAVWINPPYSRGMIKLFMDKAYQQCRQNKITVVLVVPSTADARWWPENATEIRFITQGRISFQHPITKKVINGNTKGSALIIFKYADLDKPTVTRYIKREALKEMGQNIIAANPAPISSAF